MKPSKAKHRATRTRGNRSKLLEFGWLQRSLSIRSVLAAFGGLRLKFEILGVTDPQVAVDQYRIASTQAAQQARPTREKVGLDRLRMPLLY